MAEQEEEQWRTSKARQILVDNLDAGVLPTDPKQMPPKDAWGVLYSHFPEFKGMAYSKFRDRLGRLQKAHAAEHNVAKRDAAALAHDRKIHPRNKQKQNGQLVFDLSNAKLLLRRDVCLGKHKKMSLESFHQSRREYLAFDRQVFRFRVYQEVQRMKFLRYLDMKRTGMEDSEMDDLVAAMSRVKLTASDQERQRKKVGRHLEEKKKVKDEKLRQAMAQRVRNEAMKEKRKTAAQKNAAAQKKAPSQKVKEEPKKGSPAARRKPEAKHKVPKPKSPPRARQSARLR